MLKSQRRPVSAVRFPIALAPPAPSLVPLAPSLALSSFHPFIPPSSTALVACIRVRSALRTVRALSPSSPAAPCSSALAPARLLRRLRSRVAPPVSDRARVRMRSAPGSGRACALAILLAHRPVDGPLPRARGYCWARSVAAPPRRSHSPNDPYRWPYVARTSALDGSARREKLSPPAARLGRFLDLPIPVVASRAALRHFLFRCAASSRGCFVDGVSVWSSPLTRFP